MNKLILIGILSVLSACATPNMQVAHNAQMDADRDANKLIRIAMLRAGVDIAKSAIQKVESFREDGSLAATMTCQGNYELPEAKDIPTRKTALEKVVDAQVKIAPSGFAFAASSAQNIANYLNTEKSIESNERIRATQIFSEERISTKLYELLAEKNSSPIVPVITGGGGSSDVYPCKVTANADDVFGGAGNDTDGWGESIADGACIVGTTDDTEVTE